MCERRSVHSGHDQHKSMLVNLKIFECVVHCKTPHTMSQQPHLVFYDLLHPSHGFPYALIFCYTCTIICHLKEELFVSSVLSYICSN